jgi:hypothetical protein
MNNKTQQKTLQQLINRIESYPCSMSCYSTVDELYGARSMKEKILGILKESINDEV